MLTEQQKAFMDVLDLLEEAGCMPHVVLVGSWVEFVYREAGVIAGFAPHIKTMDVDFLVRNLRRPNPAVSLASQARKRGFFVEADRLNGTTKILDMSGLEVEFLIGKMGAGVEPSLKTNIGVTAQALRHMEILSNNAIDVLCFGHVIRVPAPEAYAIHKMVINDERGGKAEKDARAVINIWPYLEFDDAGVILGKLSKKERAKADAFMREHELSLRIDGTAKKTARYAGAHD